MKIRNRTLDDATAGRVLRRSRVEFEFCFQSDYIAIPYEVIYAWFKEYSRWNGLKNTPTGPGLSAPVRQRYLTHFCSSSFGEKTRN